MWQWRPESGFVGLRLVSQLCALDGASVTPWIPTKVWTHVLVYFYHLGSLKDHLTFLFSHLSKFTDSKELFPHYICQRLWSFFYPKSRRPRNVYWDFFFFPMNWPHMVSAWVVPPVTGWWTTIPAFSRAHHWRLLYIQNFIRVRIVLRLIAVLINISRTWSAFSQSFSLTLPLSERPAPNEERWVSC